MKQELSFSMITFDKQLYFSSSNRHALRIIQFIAKPKFRHVVAFVLLFKLM